MSLHAQLSQEALQALRRQQRNSTILSIVTAALTIVLIGLILGFFLLDNFIRETPTIVTYAATLEEETPDDSPKVTTQIQRIPSSSSSVQNKVIASSLASPTAIPVPEIEIITPSATFGDTDDSGFGFGDEVGTTGGFQGVPQAMRKRCSPADRLARLRETGGTPECEQAVERALQWLKSTQNADGSWEKANQGAMTGFGLLAYLGRCETPMSAEYGESVLNAIVYLINLAGKNEGRLAASSASGNGWVYEHGIATYALAEAYTFCNQLGINVPGLADTVKKAGDMIVKGQNSVGGWLYRFAPGNEGDNSVGFWQIQALKACEYTGLWKNNDLQSAGKKAVEWLERVQGENGAIGYRSNPQRSPRLTGGGVLAIQLWSGSNAASARKGVDFMVKNETSYKWSDASSNLYYNYYIAQALINHGGLPWQQYNERFRDELIRSQNADGSWNRPRDNHDVINTHMATCLATMMLEVYYRFLPGTGAAR